MKKVKIFLGGTCASSTWRGELQEKLDETKVETFNPVVPDWTPECQAEEDYHRATDDSNKRPEKTVLCILSEANGKKFEGHVLKCALKTMKLVASNGAYVTDNLDDLAAYLNNYKKFTKKRD